jgi:TPR repeat protein
MLALAKRYSTGRGAAKNLRMAEAWLMSAAHEAPAERLLNIADGFEDDLGRSQEARSIGAKVVLLAAMSGQVDAQYAIASRLEASLGDGPNYVEAYAWYNVAAANGHQNAQNRRSALERLEKGMVIAEQGQSRSRELLIEVEKGSKHIKDVPGARLAQRKLIAEIEGG